MLEKVSKDPQMLVDIFVNYDCDIEAPNLFERMVTWLLIDEIHELRFLPVFMILLQICPYLPAKQVNALSRIAQGTQSADPTPTASSQATSIKGSSLQVCS